MKLHPALIAIGVVLVGQLFGFVGLFVVGADPLGDRDPRRRALGQADRRASEGLETAAEREVPALLSAEGLPQAPPQAQPGPIA